MTPRCPCHTGCLPGGLLALALLAATVQAAPDARTDAEIARRAKCAYLWQQVAPWSAKPEVIEHFVAEHERLGIADQWYYSLIQGFSQFGLTIGKRAPGLCYGPTDHKWPGFARQAGCRKPDDLRDWRRNITAHCLEMAYYRQRNGETGMALLARVFYPARPMYYRRWKPTDRRFRALLARGYAAGKIGERGKP